MMLQDREDKMAQKKKYTKYTKVTDECCGFCKANNRLLFFLFGIKIPDYFHGWLIYYD